MAAGFQREFPRYLSAPIQVLWFEGDELAILMVSCGIILIFDGALTWLSLLLPVLYSRIKKRKPRGYFNHLLYIAGLVGFRGYPSYFEKEFSE
ncbi:MAG: conjugal transfer protein TraL [Desulfobacteraceae bacterium]|nr:conjugal transfer protein TraL [Desulfobacteraceae bacterium]